MSNQTFKIEDGVPLPPRNNDKIGPIAQALLDMKPGQSLYPVHPNRRPALGQFAKRRGINITSRREGDACRIFKLEAK